MTLPSDRSEAGFEDFKPPYTPDQARVEANRCLFCFDAPCVQACPTSIDIPGFIRKIATDNLRGSARTILDSNVLGMSCARVCPVEVLCVGDCVYNEMGVPPIQIGKLQRYATDLAFDEGWQFFEAGAPTGRSVGIVGGGPAGLAAAHRLRRFGHAVTIYDQRPVLGGLNTTGVAPYKMKADRSLEEIAYVLAIGEIETRLGVEVGSEILPWEDLVAAHDALFVAIGLGPDTLLDLPGAHLERVIGAVEWIEQMKTGKVDLADVETAVVLGGGNTAIDVVRELVGLGVPNVEMVYRGTEAGMSGYAHEWRAAREAGARGRWQLAPVGFEGAGTDLTGVRLVRVDAHKQPVPGSELVIDADLVVMAEGQSKLDQAVQALHLRTDRGRIAVDARGATSQPFVFAGGDAANGGKEVVNAVAEGRDAAVAIHEYLTTMEGR
ncbi:MAG: FAD-dependent oxidoreductase [Bryobacterales bacterium]